MSNTELTFDNQKAQFTYVWVLENVSNWHLLRAYRSSLFTIDSMENTKWQLTMDLATTFIVFYIERAGEDDGPESIEIDYEIALLGEDGSPLIKKMDKNQFKKSSYYTLQRFEKTEDVFYNRKEKFLRDGHLTVRCRMWRTGTRMSKTSLCFVRTSKRVDRVSFVWKIKDFSTLKPKEKRIHFINPPTKDAPRLILTFYMCEKAGKEFAFVEIDRTIDTKCHAIFGKISLLDANGRCVKSSKMEECVSSSNETICLIKQCFKKTDFMSDKESLLPNDVLSLRCEFNIDVDPAWNQMETYKDFEFTIPEVSEIHFERKKEKTCKTSCSLKNFFRNCYEEGILSDVCLQAGSETFPVHRAMLSIRSPVFKTLFTKKKDVSCECIEIPEIGEDTLHHLLSYIYTDEVPELKWNEMIDLYKASYEYELIDLREICSNFLKVNMSADDFCSILILADKYQDQGLQSAVNNYGFIHSDEIFNSNEWIKFKTSEPRLAMETSENIICSIQNGEPYYVLPDEIDSYYNYYSRKLKEEEENGISNHRPLRRMQSGDYINMF